ncbi:MAG: PD-(D/E)XK nuclease family protein [Gammaproteobacteria bacterium]
MTDSSPPLQLISYGEDPAPIIATRLAERFRQRLPDLSDGVVLLPNAGAAAGQRRGLLTEISARGHAGLLGPVITTMHDWVEQTVPDPQPVADHHTSELLLVEALQGHTQVFGDQDPWRVADSLIPLFEELTLHQIPLPVEESAFIKRLQTAYGIPGLPPAALSREAAIVRRLWLAWREQLQAEGFLDAASAYLYKLSKIPSCLSEDTHIILVGCLCPVAAERKLVRELLGRNRLELILQGRPGATGMHPDVVITTMLDGLELPIPDSPDLEPYGSFLHAVYPRKDQSLRARAQTIRQLVPDSPVRANFTVFAADSAEQEAHAIDLQVRRWLLEGIQPIGVVTEDRKLARRLRALLERAGIPLQDMGGWALSTTSAAAAVERWLETVEEDFHHEPLLDLLKSPFIDAGRDRDEHLTTVYRFEQDLILHENVHSGLERYRRHLRYRRNRLQGWSETSWQQVGQLLEWLETAATPLREILTGLHPAEQLLEHFRQSLEALGLWAALEEDPAGQQLLQQWQTLYNAAQRCPIELNWLDFRTWLGRCLETHTFTPVQSAGAVQLLTLAQSRFGRFAAVVGGAFDRQHIPGQGSHSPFFNNRVRAELGLPTWSDQLQQRLHEFRSLLECAPHILLTWRREENGEPQSPSPWLEAIQVFHELAYGDDLQDRELRALLARPESRVQAGKPAPLPLPGTYPTPALPDSLRPRTLSATSHQRLIDCPYRFFAADGLGLKAPEAVKTLLEKSDYGERIHRCLQAFHSKLPKLPGPFGEPITGVNRHRAIALLTEISRQVFARDLEDNFMHRGWLRRWETIIPYYVDWQLQRQQQWQVQQTEAKLKTDLSPTLGLQGRLDRIDSGTRGAGIIDYKTGHIPDQQDIDHGEAVQLPSYALLHPGPVERVEYLSLAAHKVTTAGYLEGQQLGELQGAIQTRLTELVRAMEQGSALPAWGDDATCSYCEMEGLCRRGLWIEPANGMVT